MTEFAERRFAAQINQEQEQQELTRLAEVEGFIQKRVAQFSMDDPMLAEDSAQEARERALRELREHPDCPWYHVEVQSRPATAKGLEPELGR